MKKVKAYPACCFWPSFTASQPPNRLHFGASTIKMNMHIIRRTHVEHNIWFCTTGKWHLLSLPRNMDNHCNVIPSLKGGRRVKLPQKPLRHHESFIWFCFDLDLEGKMSKEADQERVKVTFLMALPVMWCSIDANSILTLWSYMLTPFLSFKSHSWDDKNIIVQMAAFIPVRPFITKEVKMRNYILNIWYISETLTSCCRWPEQTQSPQLTEQCSQIKRPSVSLTVSWWVCVLIVEEALVLWLLIAWVGKPNGSSTSSNWFIHSRIITTIIDPLPACLSD